MIYFCVNAKVHVYNLYLSKTEFVRNGEYA